MLKFEELSVEEIITEAVEKENKFAYNYLIKKYEGMIHGIIRKHNFYLPNGEYDDLVQEGNTGLYKAIRDYDASNGSSFEMFCKIVIKRHIITAIKKATRLKHKPMNEVYSIDKSLPDNDNLTMMDIIGFKDEVRNRSNLDNLNPEELYILNETKENQQRKLKEILSKKEKEVYHLRQEKKSYEEIMKELNIKNAKEVDNTIQRIKRKYEEIQLFDEEMPSDMEFKEQQLKL